MVNAVQQRLLKRCQGRSLLVCVNYTPQAPCHIHVDCPRAGTSSFDLADMLKICHSCANQGIGFFTTSSLYEITSCPAPTSSVSMLIYPGNEVAILCTLDRWHWPAPEQYKLNGWKPHARCTQYKRNRRRRKQQRFLTATVNGRQRIRRLQYRSDAT